MSQYKEILDKYRIRKSINQTARELGISTQVVRRTLITAGLYTSPRSERIQQLFNSGMPISDIAEFLNLSTSAVAAYLPYSRGPRKDWGVTQNAINIRKCRAKKKQNMIDNSQ